MGLLFIDGFDLWTTIPGKWSAHLNTPQISAGTGRFGGAALFTDNNGERLTYSIGANKATLYAGFAMKWDSPTSIEHPLIGFVDGGTVQCSLFLNTNSALLYARYGDGSTALGSCACSSGVWHFIEVKVVIDDTAGEFEVKVDGTLLIDLSAKDTKASSNAYANTIYFGGTTGGSGCGNCYFDDFWLADDAYYGDCRIETRYPAADSATYKQWSRSAGSDNFELVNETPPGTSDYVYGSAADLIDTYTKAPLTSTAGTVKAVAANIYCQKTNAGSKTIAGIARLSSTDLAGSAMGVASSWGFLQAFLSRPGGGSWSIADVNSAEVGIKLSA